MKNELIDVVRLQKEHGGILDVIGGLLSYLDETAVNKIDQIPKVTKQLTTLYQVLNEHVKFEEEEVLPKLISYAAEILTEGTVFEHKEILDSILVITEHSRGLSGGNPDEITIDLFRAKFKEKLQDIHWLVEDHAKKQEVILELAERVLKHDSSR